jgi:phosphoglycerate dehydrogenase-like enzyme
MQTGFLQPASSRPTASAACTTRAPNVILTPHAAYYSLEAEEEARTKAAQNVVSWSGEGRLLYPVVEARQA